MATAIGTNTVTSLVRQYIEDEIADNVYKASTLFFRLNANRKRMIQGGTQIEFPLMFQQMAGNSGGWYTGLDQLGVDPSDTVKNGAWDWKQCYQAITFDGLTLAKNDSPLAVANIVTTQFGQAEMQLANLLDVGAWSDGSNTKVMDGLKGAVDDGTVLATYAGILRSGSSNAFWRANMDTSTTTMTLTALQSMWGNCQIGGRHTTSIWSPQAGYNRYWVLNAALQAFPVQPQGADEQLAASGFSNLTFNGAPWFVDPNITANHVYFLNEDFIWLVVHANRGDFVLEDFQVPLTQDAIVAKLFWYGNLIVSNLNLQGHFTALAA